ncbi:predicted protein [Streptomyces viridosporus ATCC 14672]|uniref:Predicted protein n=1 Tax=Streptomyces viridosporus (strain ATCC 14672 / DSM 40746 / JCM 4963 / KCTC 9882 / NRRL B-12104 / FH 1290) TaxID=566461 RepID=D6AA02_STRV1|nr:predicted protein [Streptomyces viridosporus ATCC 14672]
MSILQFSESKSSASFISTAWPGTWRVASCISRNSVCRPVPESVVDQPARECRREMGSVTDLGERSRSVTGVFDCEDSG